MSIVLQAADAQGFSIRRAVAGSGGSRSEAEVGW